LTPKLSFTSTNTKLHVQVHALQAGRLALLGRLQKMQNEQCWWISFKTAVS
jgi:hypothetical protein